MSGTASYNFTGRGGNPYRTGVLLGNFVEDYFGNDLRSKYSNMTPQNNQLPFIPKRSLSNKNISEFTDKFRWPNYSKYPIKKFNDEQNSESQLFFDPNIDFSKKSVKDFMYLTNRDTSNNFDTNKFNSTFTKTSSTPFINSFNTASLNEKVNDTSMSFINKNEDEKNNDSTSKSNKKLDAVAHELRGNILFGHGCQRKFDTNDLASTYHLAFGRRIPTKTFYNPHWKIGEPFKEQPKQVIDYSDWGWRKYKEYGRFTKKFDKKKKE